MSVFLGDTDSLTDNSALCVDRERKRARLATEDRGEANYNASSSTSISAKKTKVYIMHKLYTRIPPEAAHFFFGRVIPLGVLCCFALLLV